MATGTEEQQQATTGNDLYPYVPRQFNDRARRRFLQLCASHILQGVSVARPFARQAGYARAAAACIYAALKAERADTDQSLVAARGHWEAAMRQVDHLERSIPKPVPPVKAKPGPPQLDLDTHIAKLHGRRANDR